MWVTTADVRILCVVDLMIMGPRWVIGVRSFVELLVYEWCFTHGVDAVRTGWCMIKALNSSTMRKLPYFFSFWKFSVEIMFGFSLDVRFIGAPLGGGGVVDCGCSGC